MLRLKLYVAIFVTLIGLGACAPADVRKDAAGNYEPRSHERPDPGYMHK